jgi:hypothetical protein
MSKRGVSNDVIGQSTRCDDTLVSFGDTAIRCVSSCVARSSAATAAYRLAKYKYHFLTCMRASSVSKPCMRDACGDQSNNKRHTAATDGTSGTHFMNLSSMAAICGSTAERFEDNEDGDDMEAWCGLLAGDAGDW